MRIDRMNISEQVKELRRIAEEWNPNCQINPVSVTLNNAADTIESLSEKLTDMERPAEDCGGGWIPCKERLPEDGVDVLVWFEYFRYGEYDRLFQTKGISYTFNGEWSGFVNGSSGWNQLRIIAWQPLPEPYHEP